MKRVWKCDFCTHTGKDDKEVEKHEDGCTFNPINRTCYTCDNRISGAYYDSSDECKIHDMGHFFAVDDDDKECNDWVNLKERMMKLKKIKDNVK